MLDNHWQSHWQGGVLKRPSHSDMVRPQHITDCLLLPSWLFGRAQIVNTKLLSSRQFLF